MHDKCDKPPFVDSQLKVLIRSDQTLKHICWYKNNKYSTDRSGGDCKYEMEKISTKHNSFKKSTINQVSMNHIFHVMHI